VRGSQQRTPPARLTNPTNSVFNEPTTWPGESTGPTNHNHPTTRPRTSRPLCMHTIGSAVSRANGSQSPCVPTVCSWARVHGTCAHASSPNHYVEYTQKRVYFIKRWVKERPWGRRCRSGNRPRWPYPDTLKNASLKIMKAA
jgi:hypothetical protein